MADINDKVFDLVEGGDKLDLFQPTTTEASSTAVNITTPAKDFNPNKFIAKAASDIIDRGEDTYVWKDKKKSFSAMCSTFACKVMKEAGLTLPEVDGRRYENISNAQVLVHSLNKDDNYEFIDKAEDIKAGDIVFLEGSGKSGLHAGISAGAYMPAGSEWGFENKGEAGLKWKVLGGIPLYQEPGSSGKPYEKRYGAPKVSKWGTRAFQGAYRYKGSKNNIEDYVREKIEPIKLDYIPPKPFSRE